MRTRIYSSRWWYLVLTSVALSGLRTAVAQDANSFPTMTIYATDAHASEGGSDNGAFTVRRTGSTNFPLAVFYTLSGSAANGIDYEQLGSSVQIPAGALEAVVTVKPIDDSLVEGNESVVAQLAGSPLLCATCGYNIGVPNQATVLILDNDLPVDLPVVNLYAIDDTGSEIPVVPPWLGMVQLSDPAVFIVTRTGPTNLPLLVFYGVDGTASPGVDYDFGGAGRYELPGNPTNRAGAVTIPAGDSSAAIEVWVTDDFDVEGTETVELTLEQPHWPCYFSDPPCLIVNPPPYYVIGPSNHAVADILDNDPVGGVNIYATDPEASEIHAAPNIDPPSNPALFTVRRSGTADTGIVVFYEVSGTASNGVDYQKLPGYVTLPEGVSSAAIVILPINDNLLEGTETVVLTLVPTCPQCLFANPPCLPAQGTNCFALGPDRTAVAYIRDDDTTNRPPAVRMVRPVDGETFPAHSDIQLVAFAQDPEDGYSVEVEFFEGTHSLGLGTFNPSRCAVCPNYLLTWSNVPPGEYSLRGKATDHQGAVGLSDPVRISVTGTNPPVVSIVARDAFASEGTNFWLRDPDANHWTADLWNLWHVNIGGTNTATFVVRRHGLISTDLPVQYEIRGTASNGMDYVALPGSVTIPAGKHSAQIVVVPIDDTLVEGIETVLLKLRTSPDYTVGLPAQAAAILIDNDRPRPPCLRLRDGLFHLCTPATNGFCFRIEASIDLLHWIPVCTNLVTDGALHFVDPDAPPLNARFYRAEPEQGLPPDD